LRSNTLLCWRSSPLFPVKLSFATLLHRRNDDLLTAVSLHHHNLPHLVLTLGDQNYSETEKENRENY
jgi:hypothetical protein